MFQDSRMLEILVKAFQELQTKCEALSVGVGFAPDEKSYHACIKAMPENLTPLWFLNPKLESRGHGFRNARMDGNDQTIQFYFLVGLDDDVTPFVSAANRTGAFLRNEFPSAANYPGDDCSVLLRYMHDQAMKQFVGRIEFRRRNGCDLRVFWDANRSAIETLECLNDLPAQPGQAIPDDGPHEGNCFVWDQRVVKLSPAAWQIVNLLWQKDNHQAQEVDVFEVAFGGTSCTNFKSEENKFRAVQSHIRKKFAARNIPWKVGRVGGFIKLVRCKKTESLPE